MKFKDYVWIGIFFVILGFFSSIQFKSIQQNYLGGLIPSQRSAQLEKQLDQLKGVKATLVAELAMMQSELANAQTSNEVRKDVMESTKAQLQRVMLVAGYTDVEGPGILMMIDKPLNGEKSIDVMPYLELVLTKLNEAGAEAIAINDQRLILNSELASTYECIRIDNKEHQFPLMIKAIGETSKLEKAMKNQFGISAILSKSGFRVELSKLEIVIIPKYQEQLNWKYANPND